MARFFPVLCALLVTASAGLADTCRSGFELRGWPGGEMPGRALVAADFAGGALIATQADIAEARAAQDANGRPAVAFRFTASGAAAFGAYTAAHVGEPIAIFYAGRLVSAPVVRTAITGGSGTITGDFTAEETAAMAASLTEAAACPPSGS